MELARPQVGCSSGSNPEPGATPDATKNIRSVASDENDVDCATCNHLWMRNEWFIVYGTCLTGAEATELPWRRRKDHELATQNEIRRDLELVQSLYVRGTNQGPSAFDEVKLYLREDIG